MENPIDAINRMNNFNMFLYYSMAIVFVGYVIWREYKYRKFKKSYGENIILNLKSKNAVLKKMFSPIIYIVFIISILSKEFDNQSILLILIWCVGFITQLFLDPKVYFTEEGIINLKQYSFIPWVCIKDYKKSENFNDLIEIKYIDSFREVKIKSEFEEEDIEKVLNVLKSHSNK